MISLENSVPRMILDMHEYITLAFQRKRKVWLVDVFSKALLFVRHENDRHFSLEPIETFCDSSLSHGYSPLHV